MKYLIFSIALIAGLAQAADPEWKIQYFYDKLHETMDIEDLAFPSAQHGVAVGGIFEENSRKPHYTAVVTGDGGQTWSLEPLHDQPRTLFFLNDAAGWMVGDEAIWFSEDAGHTWKKISEQKKPEKKLGPAPPGGLITRVWFLDAQHGFAAGNQKSAFETKDGGKTWTPIAAAAKPEANPAHAIYSQIAFSDPQDGIIMGDAVEAPKNDQHLPSWMEPERAMHRRPSENQTLLIETHDGGKTWQSTASEFYGSVISVRLSEAIGLALFSFSEAFEYPAELYKLDFKTGKSDRAFREKDRRLTDVSLYPGPRAFLAAVEPPGRLNVAPIPGKVRMLTSTNLTDWTEMKVDYKAEARAVVLAGPDAAHQWAATDTGMILHLVE